MSSKDTFDEMFDALLDEALRAVESEPNPNLPEIMDIEFSDEHNAAMRKIFDREKKKIRRRQMYRYAYRAAACFMGLILVLGITVISANALKIRLFNFTFNKQKTNTEIISGEEPENGKYENDRLSLGYIPSGFALKKQDISNESLTLIFENGTDKFIITLSYSEANTEGDGYESIAINGKRALYTENAGENVLIIYDNNAVCTIKGDLVREEIVETARNLIIK